MKKKILTGLALAAAGALTLAGCQAGSTGETTPGADANAGGDTTTEVKTLKVAVFNGWDEGVAASYLWKAILEDNGYNVEFEYADAGAIYSALAADDYDVVFDTWLPITHSDYMEEYGDRLVDLGAWNDEALLTIAVNEDAPITSLAELADNADLFGNEIVGIESGAGLTRITQDAVIPGYGLENMDFTVSSTPAMLAELKAATDAGENVVVTLWRPHWAYDAFPIRDLEDPQGALGAAEGIHTIGSNSFETNFPELVDWFKNFKMDSELLNSIENVMFGEYDGDDFEPIVRQWMADNQEYVDSLTK